MTYILQFEESKHIYTPREEPVSRCCNLANQSDNGHVSPNISGFSGDTTGRRLAILSRKLVWVQKTYSTFNIKSKLQGYRDLQICL